MANPFVHVELHTKDLPKAREFYAGLFGWKLQDTPMPGGGTYTMIDVGEGVGGGMMSDADAPPHWLAYVSVDDVRAKTAQAKSLLRARSSRFGRLQAEVDSRGGGCRRVLQRLLRPYMPVTVALPIALAFTMNPTRDAPASAGTSSFGTLSA